MVAEFDLSSLLTHSSKEEDIFAAVTNLVIEAQEKAGNIDKIRARIIAETVLEDLDSNDSSQVTYENYKQNEPLRQKVHKGVLGLLDEVGDIATARAYRELHPDVENHGERKD